MRISCFLCNMYGKKLKMEKIIEIRNKVEMKWESISYEKKCDLSEKIFLCALSVWIIYAFNWITMFHIQWPEHLYFYIQVFVGMAVLFRYMVLIPKNIDSLILALIVLTVFVISKDRNGTGLLLETGLFIIGARKIDYKKILKVYLAIEVPLTLITLMAARLGIIENLVYHRGEHVRMTFGFVYPTNFVSHLMFMIAAWIAIREVKCTFLELGVISILVVFLDKYCDARCGEICIILIVLCTAYLKCRMYFAEKKGKKYKTSKLLNFLCLCVPFLGAGTMILLSRFYDPTKSWMAKLDNITSTRLALGKKTFDLYDIKLWGQYIELRSSGGTTDPVPDYFFIDCSYLNILMRFGLAVFVITIFLLCIMIIKSLKNPFLLAIIVIVCIHSMIEQHLIELHYNIFFMLAFANFNIQDNRKKMFIKNVSNNVLE